MKQLAEQIAKRNLAAYEHMWESGAMGTPPPGSRVVVARYATELDLRALRPEDGEDASREMHNAILDAFADLLWARYRVLVQSVTLEAADYLRWLADTGKKNDAASRAAWVGMATQDVEEKNKRLTIDIPASLFSAIKRTCYPDKMKPWLLAALQEKLESEIEDEQT